MSKDQKEFFDKLAGIWDETRAQDDAKLSLLIDMSGLNAGDRVLDIGCGTGVLLPFLKLVVGDCGSITELDFSANMIARSKAKHRDITGINYAVANILEYQPDILFTKVLCLNFYPHVQDKNLFLRRMQHILEDKGELIIMHDMSRADVNAIHGQSTVVTEDRLPPAADVAKLLVENGFTVEKTQDTDDLYFIRGRKA